MYLEVDSRAIPYKYLSLMRSKGAYWDTILELLELLRLESRSYFRFVELKEYSLGEKTGLQIETCIGNGLNYEEEPQGIGYGEYT